MSSDATLVRAQERATLRGFANLLRKETSAWWSGRRWQVNAALWTAGLGGLVALMAFVLPALAEATGDPSVAAAGGPAAFGAQMGLAVFFELGTLALAIGVVVLHQDAIVGEKQSGVTEWLLSKPIARRSYILAKLVGALPAALALLIGLPAIAAYALLSVRSGALLALAPFLAGLGLVAIHTLFYLSLTLMLGVLFSSRAPILGIALSLALGGNLLTGLFQPLRYITPFGMAKLAALVAAGQPVPPDMVWLPLAASVVWSVVFIAIALSRFEQTEF